MYWRISLVGSLGIFLVVGGLLATYHPGFAIKIGNYTFFLLLISIFWGYFANEG